MELRELNNLLHEMFSPNGWVNLLLLNILEHNKTKKQWEDKNDDKRDVFWVIIPYFYNLFSEKASVI